MGTGVFNKFGGEIDQKSIDFWCGNCHYPPTGERCNSPALIQRCFRYPNAHQWHINHECPFAHRKLNCHCNDFPKISWDERDKIASEELERLELVEGKHGN